jgi:hypothetical protein
MSSRSSRRSQESGSRRAATQHRRMCNSDASSSRLRIRTHSRNRAAETNALVENEDHDEDESGVCDAPGTSPPGSWILAPDSFFTSGSSSYRSVLSNEFRKLNGAAAGFLLIGDRHHNRPFSAGHRSGSDTRFLPPDHVRAPLAEAMKAHQLSPNPATEKRWVYQRPIGDRRFVTVTAT